MARAPESFRDAAADYVCVKIHDMSDVDLRTFEFDYDLTLAVFLMHPDGTVYHRYGARDDHDAMSWMGMASLVGLMRATLADHEAYRATPSPPDLGEPSYVVDMPPLARRIARQPVNCVHCHTVHDTMQQWAVERGDWRPEDRWLYPPPGRIGLGLDAVDQALVVRVEAGTPAAAAGLRAGDRLVRFGAQPRVRTIADVQWALHKAAAGATEVAISYRRGDELREARLELPDGWREATPAQYAWRSMKWNLSPGPGFGGPLLDARQKKALGIDADGFAMRVQYLVDWGERRHRAVNVREAGIRKGDVVLSFGGKSDFTSQDHFHAWVRLTREVGEKVEVELLRRGERVVVELVMPQ